MKEIKRILTNYTLIDIIRLLRDKILTILIFKKQVRIIRYPFYIIGKKYIQFGDDFQSGPRLRIEVIAGDFARHPLHSVRKPSLIIGNNVSFNFNVHIGVVQKIKIGNNVLLGSNISIIDHNHGVYNGANQDKPTKPPRDRQAIGTEIIIGDNVWVSDNVVILPGSSIGDGCIIGANSVVNGNYSKNNMIAGNPARIIKQFSDQKEVWETV